MCRYIYIYIRVSNVMKIGISFDMDHTSVNSAIKTITCSSNISGGRTSARGTHAMAEAALTPKMTATAKGFVVMGSASATLAHIVHVIAGMLQASVAVVFHRVRFTNQLVFLSRLSAGRLTREPAAREPSVLVHGCNEPPPDAGGAAASPQSTSSA